MPQRTTQYTTGINIHAPLEPMNATAQQQGDIWHIDAFTVNGADFFYSEPNHNVRAFKNEMAHNATPSGQLRSVAPGWAVWAIESMIDGLANAAGQDPAQFRIASAAGGRHCERSEAIQSSLRGKLDCFAALAMTEGSAFLKILTITLSFR